MSVELDIVMVYVYNMSQRCIAPGHVIDVVAVALVRLEQHAALRIPQLYLHVTCYGVRP